jgi:hypothetical protein
MGNIYQNCMETEVWKQNTPPYDTLYGDKFLGAYKKDAFTRPCASASSVVHRTQQINSAGENTIQRLGSGLIDT